MSEESGDKSGEALGEVRRNQELRDYSERVVEEVSGSIPVEDPITGTTNLRSYYTTSKGLKVFRDCVQAVEKMVRTSGRTDAAAVSAAVKNQLVEGGHGTFRRVAGEKEGFWSLQFRPEVSRRSWHDRDNNLVMEMVDGTQRIVAAHDDSNSEQNTASGRS